MSTAEKQPLKSRAVRILTREDLVNHNNTSSCWISRNGKVYDVTGFLQDHPGGEDLILDHAGKDVGEIMKDPDEHDHSDSAYEMLEEYCIGRLGNEATIVDEAWEATVDFHPDDTDEAADFEKCQFLDLRRPLLRQVWESNWSKSFYLQQIHQPRHVPGSARMFGPDYLEMFTLTKWFVVPTIWLPIAGFLFVRSLTQFSGINPPLFELIKTNPLSLPWDRVPPAAVVQTLCCFFLGNVIWTFLEYTLHRFLFHIDEWLPDRPAALTLHFMMHGIHHYLPMDRLRLVMPPVLFFTLSWPFTRLGYLLFPASVANGIISGAFAFYVLYDCMHYALHHTKLPQYMADMKKYHLAHHYKNFELGFGVTSKLLALGWNDTPHYAPFPVIMDYFASLLRLPDVHSRPLFNPLSLGDWSLATSPFTLLIFISKLAIEQPKDTAIRLLLLPPGLYLCSYAVTFRDYALGGPQYNPWNYGVGLTSFALAMKMVHMSFIRTIPDRIMQFPSIPRKGVATVSEGCPTNANDSPKAKGLKTEPLKGTVREIVAYIFDPRCLRYDYKMAKAFRAIETRNTSNRVSFIISTFGRFILHLFLFDFFQTTLQILPLPGLGTTKGGSVYNNAFPSPLRYGVSTIAVLSTGAAVYAGLEVGHNVITLIGVGLLQLDPADHPPIFSKPWVSTSLRDLWSRRWHSVFRNYFAILGYAAGYRIMGEVGGVLGVFFLSGLLHDWTIWGMGKGTDFWRIVGFFYLQGIGLCVEATFSVVTGRKIRGGWGRAWTWLFMLTTAHLVVEAWLQRGLAGGTYFLKPEYRPVLNFYQYFLGRQCI